MLKWIPATSAELEIIGDACLLGGWNALFPRWLVVSLPGWAEPLQGPQFVPPSLSLQSRLNATADQLSLAMKKRGFVPLSCYYGSVICFCSTSSDQLSHLSTQPHAKHRQEDRRSV